VNHTTCCHCCGHVVAAYTLQLNEQLVRAFATFVRARRQRSGPVKKGEIGLTNQSYSNFQNLRHFGLITQDARGGAWELTTEGRLFYEGRTAVLNPAGHMGGMTLPPDHPAWATHEHRRVPTLIDDVLPPGWRGREEFQAEKAGVA
jgi:hypothetical protein